MNRCQLNGLTEPSGARLMRLEIALVGLPINIADMTTEKLHVSGGGNSRGTGSVHIFSADDDAAIRKMLTLRQDCKGTFMEQFDEFLELRKEYVYSVPGFGAFIKKECVAEFVEKANGFNARLRELRHSVMNLLEKRYAQKSQEDNVFYHKFILRFNPRIRYGIFLLSREYASDKCFIRACANSAYRGEARCNKENIASWVTGTMPEDANESLPIRSFQFQGLEMGGVK